MERDTVNEEPISQECRLAICLCRLARGDYYHTIAEMTGLGVSSVCTICSEVTRAIVENMWDDCVNKHLPKTPEEFKTKIVDMEELWQFPYCWSAVDGCHIPIKCPPGGLESCKEYHNFKNFYSIVLMGLVDSKCRFIWGTCGFPGTSHDAIIFQSTQLWSDIKEGKVIPEIAANLNGVVVPPLVVGDSAFPFQPWLMKPYGNAVLTTEQRFFNYRLNRARMVTEECYGQLKGRWRILLRKCEGSKEEVRVATLACMVLHNVCIDRGDTISKKLNLTVDPVRNLRRDRQQICELLQMRRLDSSHQANVICDALAGKLFLEKQTGLVC